MPEPQVSPAAARSLRMSGSMRSGSSPIGQRAQFIDRGAQAAGHRPAVEGQADAFDAGVGLDLQRDDRPQPAHVLRHVRERIVFRNPQDVRDDFGDLHDGPRDGWTV